MAEKSLINKQNVRLALLANPEVKKVSGETVHWVDQVTAEVCKNLSASGRRSPTGILMCPKMNAGLQARTIVAKETTEPAPLPEKPLPEPLDRRAQATIKENGGKRPGLPTVLLEVNGGIATTSIVGTVEVLEIDYDNINAMVGDKVFTRQVSEAVDDLLYWAKLRGSDEHAAAGEDIMKRHIELMDKRERK
jgi:hypothetical protein